MKLKEIVKNLEILEPRADLEMEISGVSYDSRRTQPGDLFVAVRGFESDGHRFIPKAVEKGAVGVLCGYLLSQMRAGKLKNLLFCATGALLSPISTWQGESIPSICHAVSISAEER